MRVVALIAAAVLGLPAGLSLSVQRLAASPQNPPVFQVRSDAVRLDVRVVDADGQFVRGLTRDDFQIVDEGVTQGITQFELVDRPRPVPAAVRTDLKADAATNRTSSDGRAYVILFDDLHISPARLDTAQEIARQFIEQHLESSDRLAISTTSGIAWVSQEFSNDRASLLEAVDRLSYVELYGDDARALRATKLLVDYLATIPDRRKSILFISEGLPLGVGMAELYNHATASLSHEARELLNASARANASFYPIDPRGDPEVPFLTIKPAPPDKERLSRFQMNVRHSLTRLAVETGGSALVGSNRFADAFQRIVDDESTYYLLGYAVAAATPRRKHHEVRVTVSRPGLTVQSRSGYEDNATPPKRGRVPKTVGKDLGDTLHSPLPLTGLQMDLTAAVFRGAGAKASVRIVLEVDSDTAGDVDVVVAAAPEESTTGFSLFKQTTLRLEPSDRPVGHRAQFATELALKPGRHHLRAAAIRSDKSSRGSVHFDFEVPDFRQAALILSDLRISTDPGGTTARRVFGQAESLVIDAEVYGESATATPLTVHGFISSAEGGIVRRHDAAGEMSAGKNGRLQFGVPLPLSDLAPGSYVIDVEVRGTGKDHVVLRRVPIAIQ